MLWRAFRYFGFKHGGRYQIKNLRENIVRSGFLASGHIDRDGFDECTRENADKEEG